MSEIKVKDLAKTINMPVAKLLEQFKQAGVDVVDAEHAITDVEKTQLLQHLSGASKKATLEKTEEKPAAKRITLKRKRVSELSTSSNDRRAKKVKVEVRKKRTYVEEEEPVEEVVEAAPIEEPVAPTDSVVEPVVDVVAEQAETASPAAPTETVDEPVPTEAADKATPAAKPRVDKQTEVKRERAQDKKQAARKQQSQHDKKLTRAKISVNASFDDDSYGAAGRRRRRKARRGGSESELLSQHGFEKPTQPIKKEVEIANTITVAELAKRLNLKAAELIKHLFKLGVMVTINQPIDQDTAILVIEELGHVAKIINVDAIEEVLDYDDSAYSEPVTRAPVVTVMGHVDHGKTSLLDYIRRSKVTTGEAGGITQHIGAYYVKTERGNIAFVDTPGHEAFTAMRARGAKVTDLVILMVAADDGVMPQTIEAVQHAKAAEVPLIVAVNKMDKPDADPDRVKTELSKLDVLPEDWGGDTMFQPISAKTGDGVDALLDAILVQSEMLELKAPVEGLARGTVIEARIDKGRGAVVTILVQRGTLRKGDIVVAGTAVGRVRALLDESGQQIQSAGPSMPVEVLGFSTLPAAGDDAAAMKNEKHARDIVAHRVNKKREVKFSEQRDTQRNSLFQNLGSETAYLPVLIKADVQGSVEALSDSLNKLSTDEVEVKIVAAGLGGITESDVYLAQASKAMIIGFNVRADAKARALVERESITLHYYSVIYDVMKDVEGLMTNLLAPERRENILGLAEVRDVFRSPKFGAVAGCMVIDGTVKRNYPIRVLRDNVVIYEGELESLRRFKDDANEVRNGMECGIAVKNYNDVKVGDQIEVFEVVEVGRTLSGSKKQQARA